MNSPEKNLSLEQAIRAQRALRELAGLPPETFPVQAFVGMISDEIETLRLLGRTDEEIAVTIAANSDVAISAEDIAENYAPSEERYRPN